MKEMSLWVILRAPYGCLTCILYEDTWVTGSATVSNSRKKPSSHPYVLSRQTPFF